MLGGVVIISVGLPYACVFTDVNAGMKLPLPLLWQWDGAMQEVFYSIMIQKGESHVGGRGD